MSALSAAAPAVGAVVPGAVVVPSDLPSQIPSPTQGVWYLGPLPLRAYALCILAGILVAAWLTTRRMAQFGGPADKVVDVSMWAVPFGIVGGRVYHVISSPQAYFGAGGRPLDAFKIWEGGLGIWGAVALGAVGAWIGCRRHGVDFLRFADALAPGLLVAQAMGRVGNYFNNELYGGPTDLPWGLQIHAWDHGAGRALTDGAGNPLVLGTFHPTFLYEALWCLLAAALLLAWDRPGRPRPARGRVFAALLMLYTLGRVVVENVRVDEANHVLGLRVNGWTSVIVFAFGAWWWWHLGRQATDDREPVDAPHDA